MAHNKDIVPGNTPGVVATPALPIVTIIDVGIACASNVHYVWRLLQKHKHARQQVQAPKIVLSRLIAQAQTSPANESAIT